MDCGVVPARLSLKASAIPCNFIRFIKSSDMVFWSCCPVTGAVLLFVLSVIFTSTYIFVGQWSRGSHGMARMLWADIAWHAPLPVDSSIRCCLFPRHAGRVPPGPCHRGHSVPAGCVPFSRNKRKGCHGGRGWDKVHATVYFHCVGIIENRHAPAYILLWNAVMVLEQRDVRVLPNGHQYPLFHHVTFQGKRSKIVLLSLEEHFLV